MLKDLWKNLKFAWKYAENQKWKLIGLFVCTFFHVIISVVTPIVSAKIIVKLTNSQLKQVVYLAVVLFVMEIMRNVISYFCHYFSQVTYRETFTSLQLDLGKNILTLNNTCIDANSAGVFIQRLTGDTTKISDVFNLLNYHLLDIMTDIGIFGAVLIIDVRIFLYMILMIFIIGLLENKRVSIRNEKDKIFRKENENVSGFVGELVRGVRDIKMLSAEKSFLNNLNHRLIDLNLKRYDMGRVQRNYQFVIGSLHDIFDLTMICLLVYLIYIGDLSIALALVVHNYLGKASYMVSSYSYLLEGIKDFNLSSARIFDIIYGNEFPKESFGKQHLDSIKGNFEFQKVSFGYLGDDLVLNDLSFNVKSQSTVAFVGKSGAGKTTIFNLLCKMYEPLSGKILIDGVDIAELDRSSIRDNITIISQNPYIFNVSIRDNLRLVKEDVTEVEIIEACRMACLDDFIETLPNGYDTIVGEGGVSLSGGQRQRLAIARAFVQKTKIILFDEATSALDNITQTKIQQAIENMKDDYTILIIAHRLSTIIHSDRILFLDDGKVVAEGSHEELLEKCKAYRELYEAEIEKGSN